MSCDVDLLERDGQLDVLVTTIERAGSEGGGSVVVRGEAGCGKTSLVRLATERTSTTSRSVWAQCEPLSSPRPLGPILEAIAQLLPTDPTARARPARLADQPPTPDPSPFDVIFGALRAEATVLVIEDLHWADGATLDVITRLAPRMAATPSTLIVTLRPDGAEGLRRTLGQLARADAVQVETPPLERDGVQRLAHRAGRDADAIYSLTAGVPFLVRAVLATSGAGLPESATDALLSAIASLDDAGRHALEVLSCVPRVAADRSPEPSLVPFAALAEAGVGLDDVESAERSGLIVVGARGAAFRHELGRLAVESTLSGARRSIVHGALLEAFRRLEADPAVLAHHAIGAGADAAILETCRDAADLAAACGAHREATGLLAAAVGAARRLHDSALAELAERSARERYLTNDLVGAIEHQRLALGVLLGVGDRDRVGRAHLWLGRYSWFRGDRAEAEVSVDTALGVWPPGDPARAEALNARARLAMLAGDRGSAIVAAEEALGLLGAGGDDGLRSSLLNNIGTARLFAGDDTGVHDLESSLVIAERAGSGEDYLRACTNAAYALTEQRRLSAAEWFIERGMSYAAHNELDLWDRYLLGIRSRWRLLRGNTLAAAEDADIVVADEGNELNRILPGLVLATLELRSADPRAADRLTDSLQLATRFGEPHRLAPILAAVAERDWLTGGAGPLDQIAETLSSSGARLSPMARGELAVWAQRLGTTFEVDASGTPYQHTLAGDHARAAHQWQDLSTPYERALALVDLGTPDALLEARGICDRLGATATVASIDLALARTGVPIPRGPRTSTVANVALLTSRQLEVLDLVAAGRTNGEIAEELFITLKTAGHHVSAILSKLGARHRTEAVAIAHDLGIVRPRIR